LLQVSFHAAISNATTGPVVLEIAALSIV